MTQSATYADLAEDFDPVWPEDHEWINVHDGRALRNDALEQLLATHIRSEQAIVVVRMPVGVGTTLPRHAICDFVAPYVLKAEIQIADTAHTSCVAILINGVAAGWSRRRSRPVG
jgi:hypothetical protein